MALQAIEAQAAVTEGTFTDGIRLTTQDFDKHTRRSYYMTLEGSLNQLNAGTVMPEWSAEEGAEHIYQRIAGVVDGKPVFQGDTTTGLMLGMELDMVKSTFPVDIGVNIAGVHGRECTKDGKMYAFVATANFAHEPKKCIFEPVSPITREMLEKYNDTSVGQMRSHVFRCDDGISSLVDNQSPLARMMRLNQDVLHMTIGPDPSWVGHLKVATPIVDACIERYEADTKLALQDMKNFKAIFERVGAETWNQPEGVIDNLRANQKGQGGHVADQRLSNVYKLVARVTVDSNLIG